MVDRVTRAGSDGYPPYNVEKIGDRGLRITLAVAGFDKDNLSVDTEDRQLVIRGKQTDEPDRTYLHRGIAARQFQRAFVLADGIEVAGADLQNGLLSVDLVQPEPETVTRKIDIKTRDAERAAIGSQRR